MKTTWLAVSAVAVTLGATCGVTARKAYAAPSGSPAAAGYQEGRWDEPPSDFNDARRRGFHEGMDAARSDFENHQHRKPEDHEAYRHPHVDRAVLDDFRYGFRRGYDVAWHHMEEHHDMH